MLAALGAFAYAAPMRTALILLVLASGCVTQDFARRQIAHETDCPESQLTVVPSSEGALIPIMQWDATGCGRHWNCHSGATGTQCSPQ